MENELVRFEFETEGIGSLAMVDPQTEADHIRDVKGKRLLLNCKE